MSPDSVKLFLSPEPVKLTKWEGAKLNCACLLRWCKQKRRTILVCGALLLVAGFAARRILLRTKDEDEAAPTLCSFSSSVSEEAVLSSISPETSSIQINEDVASTSRPPKQNVGLITNKDRLDLEECLQREIFGGWHMVTSKDEPTFEYKLLSRSPKTKGPLQYLSTTRFKGCTDTTQLKNFMTDNDYKLKHDNLLKNVRVLEFDRETGIEVWHAIKDYPVIGQREYVLATKLWEREADKSYFCVTKACQHHKAPQPSHPVIKYYLSGWRISKAAKGGCEMKVFHQEDIKSGLADFVKETFTSQLIKYVRETDQHLREYIKQNIQPKEGENAATFAEKF